MIRSILKCNDFRNISVVSLATIFAQLITLLVSAFITRVYTQSDIGSFGVYSSVISIISSIALLGYDFPIICTKNIKKVNSLISLSFIICSLIFLILNFLVVICFVLKIPLWIYLFDSKLISITTVSLFFISINRLFDSILTRNKRFKSLSISIVANSFFSSIIIIFGGIYNLGFINLAFSTLVGQISKVISLLLLGSNLNKNIFLIKINKREIYNVFKEEIKFLKYKVPQDFLSSVSNHIISVVLLFFYPLEIVGCYWLVNKVLKVPSALISNSFRNVFVSNISYKFNHGEKIFNYLLSYTLGILCVGCFPVFVLALFGPQLFVFVFGSEWLVAGEISRIICFSSLCSILISPAIITCLVVGDQKISLYYEIASIVLRVFTVSFISLLFGDLYLTVIGMVTVSVSLSFFIIILVFIKSYKRDFNNEICNTCR